MAYRWRLETLFKYWRNVMVSVDISTRLSGRKGAQGYLTYSTLRQEPNVCARGVFI